MFWRSSQRVARTSSNSAEMSQKYDIVPMAFKYDLTPQQFLFRPSSSSTTNTNTYTNTPSTRPPTYIPMASTAEEPTATSGKAPHRVPSPPRHSTDSDAESVLSTSARLIYPTSHHIAQRDYTLTVYPTTVLRLVALILFITAIPLFARSVVERAIPALVFICLAIVRILFVFIFHTPRDAHWRGRRGANLAADFALVVAISGAAGGAINKYSGSYYYMDRSNLDACAVAWVACGLIALAAVDTGRPSRIAVTTTVGLDFWSGSGALSLDNWDAERPEMGRSGSLV